MRTTQNAAPPTPAQRGLLSLPRLAGNRQLHELVSSYGGPLLVAKDLKVSTDLLSRWISGEIEVPYHFLLAVYWQSNYGFQQAFSESHGTHMENWRAREKAEHMCAQLETVVKQAATALGHDHPALQLPKPDAGKVKGQ